MRADPLPCDSGAVPELVEGPPCAHRMPTYRRAALCPPAATPTEGPPALRYRITSGVGTGTWEGEEPVARPKTEKSRMLRGPDLGQSSRVRRT